MRASKALSRGLHEKPLVRRHHQTAHKSVAPVDLHLNCSCTLLDHREDLVLVVLVRNQTQESIGTNKGKIITLWLFFVMKLLEENPKQLAQIPFQALGKALAVGLLRSRLGTRLQARRIDGPQLS